MKISNGAIMFLGVLVIFTLAVLVPVPRPTQAQGPQPGAPGGASYSCTITLSSNTTTQCQPAPAAGFRNYVQNYQIYTTAAGTATTVNVNYGTGTNCGTGNAVLTPSYANTTAAGVNTAGVLVSLSGAGLQPPTGNAICATQAGTTAGTSVVTVTGFVGP